ncbi:MAG TPA: VWA domain-containing protein [Clostridia bacterium]|nr:VWA domain-containing protein [Clostridia bacterium]
MFKYPINAIYFIFPTACLALLILGYAKKKRILKLLNIHILSGRSYAKIGLIALSAALITFSLLGPQSFKDFQKIDRKGLDIYVLADTSKSMMAEDIKPNRISRAKKTIEDLIDNLNGDRIGFIPYASGAYVQMPLTDDYQLAKMFLKVIDTDMIGGGGTNAGAAIRLAENSFDRTSSADRVVIILTDGEEHDTDTLEVLHALKDKNLKVFTIGIGTEKGGLIPVFDDNGSQIADYKKDDKGQFVVSRLNTDMLRKIAEKGGGAFLQATPSGSEISQLQRYISTLKRGVLKTEKMKRYVQHYQYYLGVGILLFILAYFIPERRKLA